MKFKLGSLPIVKKPAVLYSIEVYGALDDKDIISLKNALRREQRKAPWLSWFIGISNTDSKTAVKYTEKTGKRGRPKIKVQGNKVPQHVHIGLMGNATNSAYTSAVHIGQTFNKRKGKQVTRVIAMKGTGFITYTYKQSHSFSQGGPFDFRQCKDDLHLAEE